METNKITCESCGNTLKENINFCGKCGIKVKNQEMLEKVSFKKNTDVSQKIKWHEGIKGELTIFLIVLFLITAWHRFIFAIILLFIILIFKKQKIPKIGTVISIGVYSCIITLINISVYVSKNYDPQGRFSGSLIYVLGYIVLCILVINHLISFYKKSNEK